MFKIYFLGLVLAVVDNEFLEFIFVGSEFRFRITSSNRVTKYKKISIKPNVLLYFQIYDNKACIMYKYSNIVQVSNNSLKLLSCNYIFQSKKSFLLSMRQKKISKITVLNGGE